MIRLTEEQFDLLQSEIIGIIGVEEQLQKEDGGHEEEIEFWTTIRKVLDAGSVHPDDEKCPGCGCAPGDGITQDCDDLMGCGFWKRLSENG